MNQDAVERQPSRRARQPGLTYKFQRLREKIRRAIQRGDLSGKLPGERDLARRFDANAKTLSKALTDLAAEGLLDRSIGRGTYVAGTRPAGDEICRAWLLLCDADQVNSSVVQELMRRNPEAHALGDLRLLRPSMLARYDLVIDFSRSTSDAILRDIVVRGLPLITAAPRAKSYSGHMVRMDRHAAGFCAARDLLLLGHEHVVVIPSHGKDVHDGAAQAVARYAPQAKIETCAAEGVLEAVKGGATGVVCDTLGAAYGVRERLAGGKLPVPQRVSLMTVSFGPGEVPFSGYYVDDSLRVSAIIEAATQFQAHRPVTVWLSASLVDRGTLAPPTR